MTFEGFNLFDDELAKLIPASINAKSLDMPPGADPDFVPPNGMGLEMWLRFQPCPYCGRPPRGFCDLDCPQYPVWTDASGAPLASPGVLSTYQKDHPPPPKRTP